MAAQELQVGEYVDITISQVRVEQVDTRADERYLTVAYGADGHMSAIQVNQAVTIRRVAPAEWPPRHGDIWQSHRDGGLWVWRSYWRNDSEYGSSRAEEFVSLDGKRCQWGDQPADVLRDFGPLTLVHRVEAGEG